MKKIFTLLLLSSAWLSSAQTNFTPGDWGTSLTGYWQFENAANLGLATVGTNLNIINGALPFSQGAGPNASDKAISKPFVGDSMECTTGIGANGGGTKSNVYSVMFDFKVPVLGSWNGLLNTDPVLVGGNDGELFIKNDALGSGAAFGYYTTGTGAIVAGQWYRLLLTVDLTAAPGSQVKLYINGALFMTDDTNRGLVVDHIRLSMGPVISILGDEDGEEEAIDLGQLAVFNRALTPAEASTLGGTTLATAKFTASNNTLKVYPNPVSSNARISFNMPSSSKNANIELIDMTGRVVENIYRGSLDQGEQTISWDLKSKYNAGTYLVKLSSENTNQVFSVIMK